MAALVSAPEPGLGRRTDAGGGLAA
jgi:hypothetical protein